MSYTPEILREANQIISRRRSEAQSTYDARHLEILREIPEVKQYESHMAETGLAVIKALGMGSDSERYLNELSRTNLHVQSCIRAELKKHGYPENYLEVPYTCKKCEDTGFVGGFACSCRKELLRKLNIDALCKTSPAALCRFDNFSLDYYSDKTDEKYGVSPREKAEEIFEYCKAYAEDFEKNSGSLYVWGATGLGKTHLSLAIANVVAENGFDVLYGSAQNILSNLEREKFDRGNRNDAEKRVLGCELLIIDDLGSEFSTQFTVSALYNIINTRINLSLPVIISTNLSHAEMEARYSQRIVSRIIGNYESMMFIGRDIRQIKYYEDKE